MTLYDTNRQIYDPIVEANVRRYLEKAKLDQRIVYAPAGSPVTIKNQIILSSYVVADSNAMWFVDVDYDTASNRCGWVVSRKPDRNQLMAAIDWQLRKTLNFGLRSQF